MTEVSGIWNKSLTTCAFKKICAFAWKFGKQNKLKKEHCQECDSLGPREDWWSSQNFCSGVENTLESQIYRFFQLLKLIDADKPKFERQRFLNWVIDTIPIIMYN